MGIKALVADDHELFRSGMKQLLVDVLGAEEVREAETLDQAIEILTNQGAGDLVLVDLRMPGMSGAEALAALRDGFPEAKVAVVSAWEDRADIISALSAGGPWLHSKIAALGRDRQRIEIHSRRPDFRAADAWPARCGDNGCARARSRIRRQR